MEVNQAGSMSVNDLFSRTRHASERSERSEVAAAGAGRSMEVTAAAADSTERTWQQEDLDRGIEAMNELAVFKDRSLQFEHHDTLDRTMVKVIDRETEEIVREIPPEDFLDMISSMLEFAGIIIDERI
ncbi:flagellar protein FlaG [Alkalicoccus chagannorensis]|uniref:flagellar protein FlaG n=1 Tax=Alkalicoccus chagannorensis TaxID=427072 RepID=UPI000417F51C|nr:flagellar protein FlaG [Alkalicoccus chagannorensis]